MPPNSRTCSTRRRRNSTPGSKRRSAELEQALAGESQKITAAADARQKDTLTKIEAELRHIEQQSAVEVEKLLATTGKRIDAEMARLDAEMANLKTRLDGQFAALAKKLEAERVTTPAAPPAPQEPEQPKDNAPAP